MKQNKSAPKNIVKQRAQFNIDLIDQLNQNHQVQTNVVNEHMKTIFMQFLFIKFLSNSENYLYLINIQQNFMNSIYFQYRNISRSL